MKQFQLYDQIDGHVVAESNEPLELEIIKEKYIEKKSKNFPDKNFINCLVIQENK